MFMAMFFNRIHPCAVDELVQTSGGGGARLGIGVQRAFGLGLIDHIGKIDARAGAGLLDGLHYMIFGTDRTYIHIKGYLCKSRAIRYLKGMSTYTPPVTIMTELLNNVIGLEDLNHPDCTPELIEAVLQEAAKLASGVMAPLNWSGDQDGTKLDNGVVTCATGFKEAYAQYRDAGWNAIPFSDHYGGQNLPWALAFAVQEMWQGANMAFGLCPLLNQGAIEAIEAHGSDAQKDYYLPKLISGEWTGTMNLTEPSAGSDLSAIRTRAEATGEGAYKITGQKIYITYGEHDLADNIIHLVLARLPDAPEGVRGISLFVVPKFLEDGTRNDLICSGIEHKLGIHASPTCTMNFGDNGGATGWLVGKENEGLKAMFTMMNNARLSVGLQGVAISEAATQKAVAYAHERVQGKALQPSDRPGDDRREQGDPSSQRRPVGGAAPRETDKVSIDQHADVQRMLMTMKSMTMAGRVMAYHAAFCLDKAHRGDVAAKAEAELLTPVIKSWCTDRSVEITSIGVQVHGGMGFVEETGAAQFYRDARILPIYEGTNGIQAADLLFRKLARDGGETFKTWMAEMTHVHDNFAGPLADLQKCTEHMLGLVTDGKLDEAAMLSAPYQDMFGTILGAVMLSRVVTQPELSEFYNRYILPRAAAHAITILQ